MKLRVGTNLFKGVAVADIIDAVPTMIGQQWTAVFGPCLVLVVALVHAQIVVGGLALGNLIFCIGGHTFVVVAGITTDGIFFFLRVQVVIHDDDSSFSSSCYDRLFLIMMAAAIILHNGHCFGSLFRRTAAFVIGRRGGNKFRCVARKDFWIFFDR